MARKLTPRELAAFRKEAHLIAIANPLPDGSRTHVPRIYNGPTQDDLRRISNADRELRKMARSQLTADFTWEEIIKALMAELAREEPSTVRAYEPATGRPLVTEHGVTLRLTAKPKKKPAPERRTQPVGPRYPDYSDLVEFAREHAHPNAKVDEWPLLKLAQFYDKKTRPEHDANQELPDSTVS